MKRNRRFTSMLGVSLVVGAALVARAEAQAFKENDVRVKELRPAPYAPRLEPVPVGPYRDLDVSVWTDLGDGGTVRIGDAVRVSFRVNRDAYVAVYNVDTRGRVSLLYPRDPWDDGYTYGGRTVVLGGRRDDVRLIAAGPAGVERIVAVASDRPIREARRHRDPGLGTGCELELSIALGGESSQRAAAGGVFELGAATDPRGSYDLAPKLVPVPREPRPDFDRDETWFRLVHARRWSR